MNSEAAKESFTSENLQIRGRAIQSWRGLHSRLGNTRDGDSKQKLIECRVESFDGWKSLRTWILIRSESPGRSKGTSASGKEGVHTPAPHSLSDQLARRRFCPLFSRDITDDSQGHLSTCHG